MTSPPSRRRWFRFSLRTFFVVLTIFCVWLGVQFKWIHDRRAFLGSEYVNKTPAPWSIRILGEEGVEIFWASRYPEVTDAEYAAHIACARYLFPEAEVIEMDDYIGPHPISD